MSSQSNAHLGSFLLTGYRYFLHALAAVFIPVVLLLPHPSVTVGIIVERFPLFLALFTLTTIALASFHGGYHETIAKDRPPEIYPRRFASTGYMPGKTEDRLERGFIRPLDPRELMLCHMEGGETEPPERTSTHPSSISLSSNEASRPPSSWDSQTRSFF